MSNETIGTRVFGKRNIRERWFECAIMGCHVPESETEVIAEPLPHAGLRVCLRHKDPMDYNTREKLQPAGSRISTTENLP